MKLNLYKTNKYEKNKNFSDLHYKRRFSVLKKPPNIL